ncbi:MAG: Lrp/AsnC family transcriptional regulator, leucine-responsive regulatory protein [Paraburkholderia sp.]|jgi:Lrp/AsnC family transcriptional regulator, leucine-responsive regulatory protein|nr:Lrp/AsnC family transcriptional regulator, leucine-responsive regulatory protein [Paraburkholderia sp.]
MFSANTRKRPSQRPKLMSTDLDKTDRAILAALQNDGRMSNARLAEMVGLSETPCARRLKRLENDGYIDQYRAMLSRSALGLGVVAFVYVRFAVHDRAVATRFEREVQAIPRILTCHNVSGSADYILQVVARDLDDYGTFMRDEMRSLPGVTSVESALSLREVKANGGLPLS